MKAIFACLRSSNCVNEIFSVAWAHSRLCSLKFQRSPCRVTAGVDSSIGGISSSTPLASLVRFP